MMFWRIAGLSTASPVEKILDKESFTLAEILDEDEIIQECKALNGRLINFLREKAQVEQLVRYIVEEAPEDADNSRTLKFPFIACEIFTCEVDIILKTLVGDEELMSLLFSFLEPRRSHSTLLAGYFSKVVMCLLLRKSVPLLQYIQAHQESVRQLVELIGITSIMEVLIRLFGVDEHTYADYKESMRWIEDSDVLEMIMSKFRSSDCPEVHSNCAETLCAIAKLAPQGLATKLSSSSFIERLFLHALEESRPKSVLISLLSVCIFLLDPKRFPTGAHNMYSRHTTVTVHPGTVDGMLQRLGDLLKLLEVSPAENVLLTTYGKLQPPLGKHRLKIVEFVLVLLTVGGESAEKELIHLGALQKILRLFFDYPYNNFLHHHVDKILLPCLESKNANLLEHLFHDCNLVGKILEAEKNCILTTYPEKPTLPAEGRQPPRIGNIGHLTRISNKLIQMGSSNNAIREYLQEHSGWKDWQDNVLAKRSALENVYQWTCGRPTSILDRARDSDDDDYLDKDYDVATLANNLSQAFQYSIYNNEDADQAHGSLERDNEHLYFDDESAEVVISSLRLGDDHEGESLFTKSNCFAFEEDDKATNKHDATGSLAQEASSPDSNPNTADGNGGEASANTVDPEGSLSVPETRAEVSQEDETCLPSEYEKPMDWIEWRENSDLAELVDASTDQSSTAAVANEGEVEEAQNCATPFDDHTESSSSSVMNEGNADSDSSPRPESETLVEEKPTSASVGNLESGKLGQGGSTDEEGTHHVDKKDEDEGEPEPEPAAN